MDEQQIAQNLQANIKTEAHIPAPIIEDSPQPSAFETNIELTDPAISTQLADYFDLARLDRHNELTQKDLREVFRWAAEQAQSTDLNEVLQQIRAAEAQLGLTWKQGRLQKLARYVNLDRQAQTIRLMQQGVLNG